MRHQNVTILKAITLTISVSINYRFPQIHIYILKGFCHYDDQVSLLVYYLPAVLSSVKGVPFNMDCILCSTTISIFPRGLVVRIPPSHGGGRGSIPRTGSIFFCEMLKPT